MQGSCPAQHWVLFPHPSWAAQLPRISCMMCDLAWRPVTLLCSGCGTSRALLLQGAEGVGRLPRPARHRLLRRGMRCVHPQRHQHALRRRAHPGWHALRTGEAAAGWEVGGRALMQCGTQGARGVVNERLCSAEELT